MKAKEFPKIKPFKARPSQAHKLIGGCEVKQLTDKQIEEMNKLQDRTNDSDAKPLTPLMQEKLQDLKSRFEFAQKNKYDHSAPLSQEAMTLADIYIKEQLYEKQAPQIVSKYLTKGNVMENDAIEYASKVLGWGEVKKNEKTFENDFLVGTPDLILKDKIIDIKNAWDFTTLPLFATEAKPEYITQVNCYMALTGKRNGAVTNVLMSLPLDMIEKEYWKIENKSPYKQKLDESLPDEYTDEFKEFAKNYQYEDTPDYMRIMHFEFDYDEELIDLIANRVKLVNEYIQDRLSMLNFQ